MLLETSSFRQAHPFNPSHRLLSLQLVHEPKGLCGSPSFTSIFGLGFLWALFDNIPLTALALNQGGYDWALLAFAVGFGGSMVWLALPQVSHLRICFRKDVQRQKGLVLAGLSRSPT
jgi:hypothetical protein